MTRLRVLALNAWSGLDYQGHLRMGEWETPARREARYRLLVDGLRALDPDVVAVNEANPLPAWIRRLAADLGYDEIHHPGLSGLRLGPLRLPVNLCEGDGLLARPGLGLRWAGRRVLTGGTVARRGSLNFANSTQVVAGTVEVAGRRLHLFCTHWSIAASAGDYARQGGTRPAGARAGGERAAHDRAAGCRRREAEGTLELLRSGDPGLLLGDLNAPPEAPEIGLLRDAGWVDAWAALRPGEPGATWDEHRNPHARAQQPSAAARVAERVDYVFASPSLADRLRTVEVVLDGDSPPSDHYGVLCEIDL